MRKVISCAYLENVQTMELRYTDVTLNNIDCMDVEGKIARNMNKWSGLKMLFNAGSLTIPKLILDSVEVPIGRHSVLRNYNRRCYAKMQQLHEKQTKHSETNLLINSVGFVLWN